MRTTNCKISMFCSVSSICHFISDVCKFNFYLPFTKKLLLCIFATKVGYVLMAIYVCSLNVIMIMIRICFYTHFIFKMTLQIDLDICIF